VVSDPHAPPSLVTERSVTAAGSFDVYRGAPSHRIRAELTRLWIYSIPDFSISLFPVVFCPWFINLHPFLTNQSLTPLYLFSPVPNHESPKRSLFFPTASEPLGAALPLVNTPSRSTPDLMVFSGYVIFFRTGSRPHLPPVYSSHPQSSLSDPYTVYFTISGLSPINPGQSYPDFIALPVPHLQLSASLGTYQAAFSSTY